MRISKRFYSYSNKKLKYNKDITYEIYYVLDEVQATSGRDHLHILHLRIIDVCIHCSKLHVSWR